MVNLPKSMELNAGFHLQLMNFENTLRYTLGHQGHNSASPAQRQFLKQRIYSGHQ